MQKASPNLARRACRTESGSRAPPEAQIAAQIRNPKHGVMPAWVDRLGEPTIKQLAVYVHTLGGGL